MLSRISILLGLGFALLAAATPVPVDNSAATYRGPWWPGGPRWGFCGPPGAPCPNKVVDIDQGLESAADKGNAVHVASTDTSYVQSRLNDRCMLISARMHE